MFLCSGFSVFLKHFCDLLCCSCMQEVVDEDDDIQVVSEKIVMRKESKVVKRERQHVKRERLHVKPEPGLPQLPPFIRRPWQVLEAVFLDDFALADGSLPSPLQLSQIGQGHSHRTILMRYFEIICL